MRLFKEVKRKSWPCDYPFKYRITVHMWFTSMRTCLCKFSQNISKLWVFIYKEIKFYKDLLWILLFTHPHSHITKRFWGFYFYIILSYFICLLSLAHLYNWSNGHVYGIFDRKSTTKLERGRVRLRLLNGAIISLCRSLNV